MSNVVNIIRIPRAEAYTSVNPDDVDLAYRIRSGRFDRSEIVARFEKSGFAEWFERQGLPLYRASVIGS